MKFSANLLDLPFPQSSIADSFQKYHEHNSVTFPGWSLPATRRKLAGDYWLKIILNHFILLLAAGTLIVFIVNQQPASIILPALIPASTLVFAILFLFMYWPAYQLDFLPQLDNCIENHKRIQLNGIPRCKKEQYSVVSLMLIQCVLMEMAGIAAPLINTASAQLLARQYGVSVKSISPALKLILRGNWDHKSIRKHTEITDDFETAKEYFKELGESQAIKILEKLQNKILQ
jgi:hypothetical protein